MQPFGNVSSEASSSCCSFGIDVAMISLKIITRVRFRRLRNYTRQGVVGQIFNSRDLYILLYYFRVLDRQLVSWHVCVFKMARKKVIQCIHNNLLLYNYIYYNICIYIMFIYIIYKYNYIYMFIYIYNVYIYIIYKQFFYIYILI